MPGKLKGKEDQGRDEQNASLIQYAAIAIIMVIIAAVVLALQNNQGGLKGCTGIILEAYRDSCISRLAYSTANVSLCSYLPSGQADSCISYIAENRSDAALCSGLSTSAEGNACMGAIANEEDNYTLCREMNGSALDACVTSIASRLAQPGECTGLSSRVAAQICANASLLSGALHSENPNACGSVTNRTGGTLTSGVAYYSGVFTYSGNGTVGNGALTLEQRASSPLSVVQFLNASTYSSRDLCYIYMAAALRAPQYCADVPNATIANVCSGGVQPVNSNSTLTASGAAVTGGNSTQLIAALCKNLTLTAGTCNNFAQFYHAVSTRNLTLCGALSGGTQYQCYITLAKDYNNTNICSYITNATVNAACIEDVTYNNTVQ